MSCEQGDIRKYIYQQAGEQGANDQDAYTDMQQAYQVAVRTKGPEALPRDKAQSDTQVFAALMRQHNLQLLRPGHMGDQGMPSLQVMRGYAACLASLAKRGIIPDADFAAVTHDEREPADVRARACVWGAQNARNPERSDATPTPQPARMDVAASIALAKRIGAQPKQCWQNASAALRGGHKWPKLVPAGSKYVEGWAHIMPGMAIPFEHGWIETPNGDIIDPTVALLDGLEQLRPENYYAGATYTAEEVSQQSGKPPWVWKHGWGGFDHPGYKAAHDAANAHFTFQNDASE